MCNFYTLVTSTRVKQKGSTGCCLVLRQSADNRDTSAHCAFLSRYFEQRLRATEESYREEIALLQLRLVEGALEESLLKTGDARYTNKQAYIEGLIQSLHISFKTFLPTKVWIFVDCFCLFSFTTEGDAAEERNYLLAEFTLKLEKHKVASQAFPP